MKVVVDRELCQGHGQCIDVAPEVFMMEDDGIAIVIVEEIGEKLLSKVEVAVSRCPADAIKILSD